MKNEVKKKKSFNKFAYTFLINYSFFNYEKWNSKLSFSEWYDLKSKKKSMFAFLILI
jgi:hypothetical protein